MPNKVSTNATPENEQESVQTNNGQSQSSNPITEEQQKLNAVRDLLFGQNVQEYRSEFEDLKKIIDQEKKQTEQAAADLKDDLVSRLDNLEALLTGKLEETKIDLTEKLDQINDSKADRKKLADMLHKLASTFED